MARSLVVVQPVSDVLQNEEITPTPAVAVYQDGVLDADLVDGEVTLTLEDNEEGAVLLGPTTARVSGGIAEFPNLSVDKPGSYRLVASCDEATLVYPTQTRPTLWRFNGSFSVSQGAIVSVTSGIGSTTATVETVDSGFVTLRDRSGQTPIWQVVAGQESATIAGVAVTAANYHAINAPGIDMAGALAMWRLGDGGTDPRLELVSGALASVSGTRTPAEGPVGVSQYLPGGSSRSGYESLTNSTVRNYFHTGNWTIAALVKPETLASSGVGQESTILALQGTNPALISNECIGKLVIGADGFVFPWFRNITTIPSMPIGGTGRWVLLMARVQNGVVSVGVNGLVGSSYPTELPGTSFGTEARFMIGHQHGLPRDFKGWIEEVWVGPAMEDAWFAEQARRCGVAP